jgi:hypothetical protein
MRESSLLLFFLLSYWIPTFVRAGRLVAEGEGTITGYVGTIYIAQNYRPICGTLASGQTNAEWNNTPTCRPAMHAYRDITDTFGLYTLTGIRLSDTVAFDSNTELCMCFSLPDLDGKQADICVYVTGEGVTQEQFADGRMVAISSFWYGSKALPNCYEINTSSVDATDPNPTVSTTSNRPSSSSTSTTVQTTPQGNSPNGNSGTDNVSSSCILFCA